MLSTDRFRNYIDYFNYVDDEPIQNEIPNAECWDWLKTNIPWFECPDPDIEQIYYFRWWMFRKHLRKTSSGNFVITEFLPEVGHSRLYNTIACAAGLHIEEARWLRNRRYVSDYIRFWFSSEGEPRNYSNWLAHAILSCSKATADFSIAEDLLDDLIQNFRNWEKSNQHESGLFWSIDGADGGEHSISGNGLRPTLNSYMYGDATAIAALADRVDRVDVRDEFREKASRIKSLVQEKLWDPKAAFFKNKPLAARDDSIEEWGFDSVSDEQNVREIYGFLPWKFKLPGAGYENAWSQLVDNEGFHAPYGPTTAEQRHPYFMKNRIKRCQWDGSSWPFTTSLTIGALSEFLHSYSQDGIGKKTFFDLLAKYAHCHYRELPYGEKIPWIGESLHPYSGVWLSRAIALEGKNPLVKKVDMDKNHAVLRGKDYNHSSFCDLVISGLVGLRPEDDGTLVVSPLLPEGTWDWFCLDGIEYSNVALTMVYDRYGTKYGYSPGLHILADGKEIGHSPTLATLKGTVSGLSMSG